MRVKIEILAESLQIQDDHKNQHGRHMTSNNGIEQHGVWYPEAQVWSVQKSNYPDLTGAPNSGLPQKRQSLCPWPRKSPLESIAAPKLWRERKKEGERYLKPRALRSLSTCCRLSDSPSFSGTELLHYMKTLTLFFLPVISPPFFQ